MRLLLLLAAILLPPIGAFLYFVVLRDSTFGNEVYMVVKLMMLLVAIFGWRLSGRSIRRAFQGTKRDVILGVLVGCGITLILIGTFFLLQPLILPYQELIQAKAVSLFPLALYIPLAIVFSIFHSLFEEWYWRGFVHTELAHRFAPSVALIVSALAFSAHHVIVLSQLFPGILTTVFSLGIFIAALIWITLYRRTGNLLAPWISHIFADATIFAIGYMIIYGI
ncbi:MAG: CPBP family intramembrane glutamic endopeptidase [Patescibacteria group bacterium]